VDDVKSVVSNCKICCRIKPQFYRPKSEKHLIRSTRVFDRLNIDYKGPLPSSDISSNKYILNIIDEYSRFEFAFATADMTWQTVQSCLYQVFAMFGMPSYIHSDRGSNFLCGDLKEWLHSQGICTSRTTSFNPQGNGQCEKYNGTLWKAIMLNCETNGYDKHGWEKVLPAALHSIRSLLCTATNATPHERMFGHMRRTPSGETLPVWLTKPGPVLLKRHVKKSKYDPSVDEATLLEANPNYAHVRLKSGAEKTVSLRDLAPIGGDTTPDTPLQLVARSPIVQMEKSVITQGERDMIENSNDNYVNIGHEDIEVDNTELDNAELVNDINSVQSLDQNESGPMYTSHSGRNTAKVNYNEDSLSESSEDY